MTPERFNACEWLVDRHVTSGGADITAFVCRGEELSYGQLLRAVHSVANGLLGLGCGSGDRVLMVVDDEPAFAVVFLAAMRVGAVPVPVSTMLRPGEIAPLASDSAARVLACSPRHAEGAAAIIAGSAVADLVITDPPGVDGRSRPAPPAGTRVHRLSDWTDSTPVPPAGTGPDSEALWLYTSGTTGSPKGAIHLHRDLRAVAETYAATVLGIGPGDLCYSVAKLFFAFGLGNALIFPLAAGAGAVLDPDPPTPARVAELAARHRPTLFFAPPGFCAALADSDVPADILASARATVTAGEVLPEEVQRRFQARFGTEMLDGIGSTEALHIFCSNHPGRGRAGTSGQPVAGYQLKLLDEDGTEITGSDTAGALWVRGPSIAAGYWQRPELNAETFVDGWLRTGDFYLRSDDGYYRFVGRNSDMIKAGGIWVSPAEVESVLLEHPAVLEAAVIGSRDHSGLETTVAFVVPRRGATIATDDLLRHCRESMASFKRPREIHVVTGLPRTATGKVKRFELRATLSGAAGSTPSPVGPS